MVMVTVIDKRIETVCILDFFDPELKKIETVMGKRNRAGTETMSYSEP